MIWFGLWGYEVISLIKVLSRQRKLLDYITDLIHSIAGSCDPAYLTTQLIKDTY